MVYAGLGAVPACLGSLAAFVTRNSANDPKSDGWATAIAGGVCGLLYILAALFFYFARKAVTRGSGGS